MKNLIFLFALLGCISCETGRPSWAAGHDYTRHENRYVSLNAFGSLDSIWRTYAIEPAYSAMMNNELEYAEYVRHVKNMLASKGYAEVGNSEADLVFTIQYNAGVPKANVSTAESPVYGFRNEPVVTKDENGNDKITTTSVWGITHSETRTSSYNSFRHSLQLIAWKKKSSGGTFTGAQQLWAAEVTHEISIDDLRLTMPFMVYALKDYIGKDTRKQIDVKVDLQSEDYKTTMRQLD